MGGSSERVCWIHTVGKGENEGKAIMMRSAQHRAFRIAKGTNELPFVQTNNGLFSKVHSISNPFPDSPIHSQIL